MQVRLKVKVQGCCVDPLKAGALVSAQDPTQHHDVCIDHQERTRAGDMCTSEDVVSKRFSRPAAAHETGLAVASPASLAACSWHQAPAANRGTHPAIT